MMKVVLLLAFVFSSIHAQDESSARESNVFEYTRRISKVIDSIDKIKLDEFSNRIDEVSETLEKYFEYKKGVCRGEFSTIIFQESQNSRTNFKLTKKEQLLCFRELKALQVKYITKIFKVRKNYLEYMHTKRLEELKKVRAKALEDVQQAFQDTSSKKKRRRRR